MGKEIPEQNCVLVSCRTLAKMMNLSPRTVWRLRSAGKLPKAVSIGSSIRWRISDINLFIGCDCDMQRFESMKESEK